MLVLQLWSFKTLLSTIPTVAKLSVSRIRRLLFPAPD
jgi:hypothetical protein